MVCRAYYIWQRSGQGLYIYQAIENTFFASLDPSKLVQQERVMGIKSAFTELVGQRHLGESPWQARSELSPGSPRLDRPSDRRERFDLRFLGIQVNQSDIDLAAEEFYRANKLRHSCPSAAVPAQEEQRETSNSPASATQNRAASEPRRSRRIMLPHERNMSPVQTDDASSLSEPTSENEDTEDEIPPYHATLHKYLDLLSYDPRIVPCLRVNRALIKDESELFASISSLVSYNILPESINPFLISHIDDRHYDDLIPDLFASLDEHNTYSSRGIRSSFAPDYISVHSNTSFDSDYRYALHLSRIENY